LMRVVRERASSIFDISLHTIIRCISA
jgi:hypothetical protein